jgi:hypothetical protein
MKLMKSILIIALLLAAVVIESLAQSSSSATQTVTFGVRRSAPIVVASTQPSMIAVQGSVVERTSPLKITVGSESRSLLAFTSSYASADEPMKGYKASIVAPKSTTLRAPASTQSVVTLTE